MKKFGTDGLYIDEVIPDLQAGSRKDVFQMIASKLSARTGLPQLALQDKLMDRERQASSGVGDGVSIPHLKIATERLTQPLTLLARLHRKLDFQAVDGQPVDLVYLLVSPERDGPLHLQRLARMTRMMRNTLLLDNLRAARDGDTIRALLTRPTDNGLCQAAA